VTDAVKNGGLCAVTGGTGVSVPASGSITSNYTCTYASAPSPASGTNTATAAWNKTTFATPTGSASGTAGVAFITPTTKINQTITVTDTFNGVTTTLGTLTGADSSPFTTATYNYPRTVNVPLTNCVKYTNTATIVETGQTASQTIEVCGPAATGALTMGFWQNKNGQGIIVNGGPSCAALATWLEQFHPFSDLSATLCGTSAGLTQNKTTASSGVAGYIYDTIKAAQCTSTTATCNAMLKAQMLATALDVYFSSTALGGNQIGAPSAIGSLSIDLTKICTNIPSCTSFENVSSAFGGASTMTVMNMLVYQNTSDPGTDAGANWYGQVKATQVLAKDAFDAINNQVAFAP
jgi:hypothetical protein